MPMDIDAQSDVEAAHPQAPIPPAKVLRAVEEIVNSRLFRTSPQCQKLLRYVVVHTLEGKEEELKERIIGSEVFGRPQDYNTSDDPVVRTSGSRRAQAVGRLLSGGRGEGGDPDHHAIGILPGFAGEPGVFFQRGSF